jgi:hypothetical protein
VAGASQLILLKSATYPSGESWQEASGSGYVDAYFVEAAKDLPCVRAVNFRALAVPDSVTLARSASEGRPR